MNDLAPARAPPVRAVVVWIDGVWMVATVLLRAIRHGGPGADGACKVAHHQQVALDELDQAWLATTYLERIDHRDLRRVPAVGDERARYPTSRRDLRRGPGAGLRPRRREMRTPYCGTSDCGCRRRPPDCARGWRP